MEHPIGLTELMESGMAYETIRFQTSEFRGEVIPARKQVLFWGRNGGGGLVSFDNLREGTELHRKVAEVLDNA